MPLLRFCSNIWTKNRLMWPLVTHNAARSIYLLVAGRASQHLNMGWGLRGKGNYLLLYDDGALGWLECNANIPDNICRTGWWVWWFFCSQFSSCLPSPFTVQPAHGWVWPHILFPDAASCEWQVKHHKHLFGQCPYFDSSTLCPCESFNFKVIKWAEFQT